MKLSVAIRLGAMLKPQVFGAYANARGTCALGAAYEASGLDACSGSWPWSMPLPNTPAHCPECKMAHSDFAWSMAFMVMHLNDIHEWTRERIADWVEQIERQQEPSNTDAPSASLEVVR